MRHRIARADLAIGVAFVVVVIVAFWPLFRDFPRGVWADSGDGAVFLWSYWRIPRALLQLDNPFSETGLFYPVGAHLAFNTNTPLLSVLSWPLQKAIGLPGTSVVLGASALISSGVAMYALVRRVGASRPAGFFAGVAFILLPWRTNRIITHMNLIHTEFTVLAILAALALLDRPRVRNALLLGAVLAAAVLTDLATATMAGLAAVTILVARWRDTLRPDVLRRLPVVVVTAIVGGLPILVPLLADVRAGEAGAPPGLGGADGFSADVLSWLLPYARHPLWGSLFRGNYESVSGNERFAYVGLVVAALAVLGAIKAKGRRSVWITVAVVFGLLSFGPGLHVNGWTGSLFTYQGFRFSIPMPYLLLHQLPFAGTFRAPARFASVAQVGILVLAALGLDHLAARLRPRVPALAVVGLATALMVVDFLPPTSYLRLDPTIDPAWSRMAADPSPGAVLDIPLQFRHGFGSLGDPNGGDQSRFMYSAIFHQRPMVGGSAARIPDQRLRALQEIPLYRDILRVEGQYGPPTEGPTFTAADLDALGIRFVVHHLDTPVPVLGEYLKTLGLERYPSSDRLEVWKVPEKP